MCESNARTEKVFYTLLSIAQKILQNNIHFQVPNCLVELSVKEVKDGYLNSVSKEKTFKAHKGHKK